MKIFLKLLKSKQSLVMGKYSERKYLNVIKILTILLLTTFYYCQFLKHHIWVTISWSLVFFS